MRETKNIHTIQSHIFITNVQPVKITQNYVK